MELSGVLHFPQTSWDVATSFMALIGAAVFFQKRSMDDQLDTIFSGE